MAAWYDGVEVYVELAWGAGPLTAAASRTWTDHSDACMSIDIMRGSQSEFGHTPPGTATIVLNDPGRVFDASNTAGAHYGSIVPMVPVRVRAGAVALFTGFVAAFVLSWPAGGKAPIATLTCVDGTRPLEAARLPGSAFEAEILADDPAYYWPLQSGDLTAVVGGVDLTAAGSTFVTVRPGGAPAASFPLGQSAPSGRESTAITGEPESYVAAAADIPTLAALPQSLEFVAVPDPATGLINDAYVRISVDDSTYFRVEVSTEFDPSISIGYSDVDSNTRLASADQNVYIGLPSGDLHVVITKGGSTVTVYVNGRVMVTKTVEAGTWTTSSTNTPGALVRMFGTAPVGMSHVAFYPSALSAAQISAHYDAGLHAFGHPYGDGGGTRTGRILDAISHPSADRDIDAGSTVLDAWLPDGGDALSAIRETVGPEQALFHFAADGDATWLSRNWQRTATEAVTPQATFGDQVGEIRYTDDAQVTRSVDNIYNYSTVTYADGSVSAEDATSIAAYGEQRDSVSAGLIDDAFTARQLAAARVREHKDAADRIDVLTILPRRGNDAAPNAGATSDVVAALAGLDLGYRVAVNRRPTGGTGTLALEPVVRGIAHQIDMSAKGWRTTLYLAPAPTSYEDGPWLTLGDPTYGDIGIAAGNLIPY